MATNGVSPGARLLDELRHGLAVERVVRWPGSEIEVVLVPLAMAQLQAAEAAAQKRFRELGLELNLYTVDDWHAECNVQVLALALRDPADATRRRPLFDTADELRERINPDERNELTAHYARLQDSANPDPNSLSADAFTAIDEAIKKKDVRQLSAFDAATLAGYMLTLDERPPS